MNHQQRHWLEKFQVELVVAGAMAAVYFTLWKLIDSGDPQGPLSLLAAGDGRAPVAFALLFWVLAGLCAAVTVPVRPASAMLAALIGMVGLSLRSGPMRILVWSNMDRPAGLYHWLIVEIVLLSAVLLGAAVIIGLVRTAIRRIRPGWLWKDPLPAGEGQAREPDQTGASPSSGVTWLPEVRAVTLLIRALRGAAGRGGAKTDDSKSDRADLVSAALFSAVATVIAAALLLALMRSSDRGQIIFALVASFFLAVFVAHQKFPTPCGAGAWLLPAFLAVCSYVLAATAGVGPAPQGWIEVSYYARALPVDWMTAGAGGAMLGYWVSLRVHEARYFEKQADAGQSPQTQET